MMRIYSGYAERLRRDERGARIGFVLDVLTFGAILLGLYAIYTRF